MKGSVLLESGVVAVAALAEGLEAVTGGLAGVLAAFDGAAGGELDELPLELLGDEEGAGLAGGAAVEVVGASGSTYC